MRSEQESRLRKFNAGEHIRKLVCGEFVALYDETGRALEGIRGRAGVVALTASGVEIGVDYIEMQPGSAFQLHVHPGDHILYCLSGQGLVHVDGENHAMNVGDTVFIPAEYPHGVKNESRGTLRFLAFGHPHKPIDATDRMRYV